MGVMLHGICTAEETESQLTFPFVYALPDSTKLGEHTLCPRQCAHHGEYKENMSIPYI